jgi:hypothetical protein
MTVADIVDILTICRARPWVQMAGQASGEVALAALRRDMPHVLAHTVMIEYYDPRDARLRHGSLIDYAKAVLAHVGLV